MKQTFHNRSGTDAEVIAKREKREQEKDKRDLEYHEKRMKDFK